MSDEQPKAPGWYRQRNVERWWDGEKWSERIRPAPKYVAAQLDESGSLRCPECGSRSFTRKRRNKGGAFAYFGLLGLLFAPKRLNCDGCGVWLKTAPSLP